MDIPTQFFSGDMAAAFIFAVLLINFAMAFAFKRAELRAKNPGNKKRRSDSYIQQVEGWGCITCLLLPMASFIASIGMLEEKLQLFSHKQALSTGLGISILGMFLGYIAAKKLFSRRAAARLEAQSET